MSALAELHEATAARLKGDSAVAAIVGVKVFDRVAKPYADPDTGQEVKPVLPWITVDALTGVEEGSTLDHLGYGHTVSVSTFTDGALGLGPAYALSKAVKAALLPPLSLSGHSSTRLRLDFETNPLEEPGNRMHVPMRFRTFAMETA